MVMELVKQKSVASHFIAELRDVDIQKDPMRFRRNLERIGEVIALELSRTLEYQAIEVTTPLGVAQCDRILEQPVLATILRAGLPLHQGMLNYFDRADSAFVSAYRKHRKGEDSFEIEVEYLSSPSLEDRVVVLCDPMLATGRSMVMVYKALLRLGKPKAIHVAAAIASAEGLAYTKLHLPAGTRFWIGAVDDEMTAQAYIVPGLGDAGDLAYGAKM
ncbi:MAG: uracil phosphoribosyltransferase [Flavobacteriales bacterium]|jgi:uracil phosphoribosyltransferase|nr:uracil phosphoribosyltransferase [Flavobacteriales bacterium]MBK6550524.1 uracil phosphoribosyltransferase [Flavobacteriales bacterium]MBK6882919.1 uracil phosphoribosyltransferase [Flavobacteriales bacterium]MBK7101907.1 uracil phosphoribosyltransferase [Flavobacteriales bacterium]MBK7114256.1 uracil phosphoribosyltransferase [Flavobacteriales bacterium]